MSLSGLTGQSHHRDPRIKLGDYIVGNSRIPYRDPRVKPEDDTGLGNSRIFVIASEAKQSLGILEFIYGILNLFLKF